MNASDRERLATALAGRYTLQHELGQGGMAIVYRGIDLKHDRHVAFVAAGGRSRSRAPAESARAGDNPVLGQTMGSVPPRAP
ncbi:MAG TPA: hypothetical protein VGA20_08020 [Gemmatimonadales bacterium]